MFLHNGDDASCSPMTILFLRTVEKASPFRVYRNRVEVSERKMLQPEKHTYRMADIARVDVKDTPVRLHIVMKDGTDTAFQLSGNAAAARSAIMELM